MEPSRFITVFTTARHLSLSWDTVIHETRPHSPFYLFKIHFNIILPSRPLSLKHPHQNPVCTWPHHVLHAQPISFFLTWAAKHDLRGSFHPLPVSSPSHCPAPPHHPSLTVTGHGQHHNSQYSTATSVVLKLKEGTKHNRAAQYSSLCRRGAFILSGLRDPGTSVTVRQRAQQQQTNMNELQCAVGRCCRYAALLQ